MRIGFDVDGIFANFNPGYIAILNQVGLKDMPTNYEPQRWHYEADLGFTPENVKKAWETIGQSKHFWRNLHELEPVPSIVNSWLHEVYFITARPGTQVKKQTEDWLREKGVDNPTVLISPMKGSCCHALNLDLYIDDRLENIEDVEIASPSTRAYLITRSYNVNGNVLRRADSVLTVLRQEGLVSE